MNIYMICENCSSTHDGSYGSGRFCSVKCSRGFSTKSKRTEINRKVSLKLKKTVEPLELICEVCTNTFTALSLRRSCSKKCSNLLQVGKKKIGNYSNNGGLRENGGRSKTTEYTNIWGEKMKLNKEEIIVAQILDTSKVKWIRNWKGFPYITKDGEQKKFYPDFYISEQNLYIEYKGWITEKMSHKMSDAQSRNNLKLLIVVGSDKRYIDMGLSLEELAHIL